MNSLFSKIYYTNKYIEYLINVYICEYDIRRAGPSALLAGGCISRPQFEYLCSFPGVERQIKTGLLIKQHPEYEEIKKKVIENSRQQFLDSNSLLESDVLAIKNDAIFVIKKTPTITTFQNGLIEFVPKNTYTSYYRYGRTEMYYFGDMISDQERIDIKNIGDDKVSRHAEFMLDFLYYLFGLAQTVSVSEVISALQHMMNEYIRLNLPMGYYREFNARSEFKLNLSEFTDFYATFLPDNIDKNLLDINYNLSLLRFFYKVFSNIYFNTKK